MVTQLREVFSSMSQEFILHLASLVEYFLSAANKYTEDIK